MIYSNISGLKASFDYISGPRNIRFAVFNFAGAFTSAGAYFCGSSTIRKIHQN